MTLTGTNFTAAGTTVNVVAPANGLFVTGVTVVNSTTITATFNNFGGAAIGPRSIFVTTPGGSTGTVIYTVTGPVLTSIAPVSAIRGQTVPISLFGSGLTGTTAINVSGGGGGGGGLTVTGLTVVSDTQVNANFVISAGASGTARTVTVTAPGGTSNGVTFTVVVPPAPTLTSIAPPTGVRGTSFPVTLTGTNLTGASAVNVSGGGGSGVTVSALAVQSPTQATATFTISTGATLGARTVSITTSGGTSNTVPFTVQGATLTSIAPNTGVRGTTVPVTFTGANLTGTTGLNGLGGTGVSLVGGSLTVVNSTTVTANLAISNGATLGILNIGLATTIGNTNTIPFTVTGATVAIAAPTPSPFTTTPATTATKTGTFTVTNAATATAPFTLTANPTVNKLGGAGGTFSIATGGTCVSGFAVNPGANCTIIVQYAPGTSTATATANVGVTGTGSATVTSANFTAN